MSLVSQDSSRIKKKHKPKERWLYRLTDRLERLNAGQKSLYEVLTMHRNERNRLHCTTGPAVVWEDGLKLYMIDGIRFDYPIWKALIDNTLDALTAIKIPNLTQRRYAIKRIGYAEMVKELGFTVVETEGTYRLLEGNLNDDQGRLARILQVKCPSTGFDYFLRLPPPIPNLFPMHIHEALAWTFGFDRPRLIGDFENNPDDYHPEVET